MTLVMESCRWWGLWLRGDGGSSDLGMAAGGEWRGSGVGEMMMLVLTWWRGWRRVGVGGSRGCRGGGCGNDSGGGCHGGVAVWRWLRWWHAGNEEWAVVVTDVVTRDALMSMERVFKTHLRRRRVKQSGEIDIEFKIVDEYAGKVNKIKAEAVATACYTQNRSIIRLRHGKTPYELLHDKIPDLSFFHVFGALCYPTNDSENLGKLQPKADIDFDELAAMAFKHSNSGLALHEMTPATISLRLVLNPPPSTPVDHPAPRVIAVIIEVVAPEPAASTSSPSSTTVDQDAPSPINSQTARKTQSPFISNDVEEDNHDLDVEHMNNDPFFGVKESPKTPTFRDDPLHESLHENSTSLGS
nr:integrase, catalytic region, zinc finger, CCHC-type, peptidase aspartic, catalytic [Tanacetum cinerariifolium]